MEVLYPVCCGLDGEQERRGIDTQGMGHIASHCGWAADAQPEHASEAIAIAPSAIRSRTAPARST
jgi:hypothetical protein